MANGWSVTTRASAADPSPAAAAGWTVAKRGNLSNARPVAGDVPDNRIRDGITGPLTSFYQGATLDYGDEALGALAGGAGYVFSGGDSAEAKRAYEAGRDLIRETQQSYARDNPVLSMVYQLGGSLVPVIASGGYALGSAAPALGARVAGAAATGAIYSGITGFGAGEGGFENRVGSAAAGVVGGAVFGGGAELGATAVGRIFNSLRSRFGPQARLVDENGRPTPQAEQAAQEAGLDINQVPLPALEAVERRGGAAAAEGTPEMLRAQSLPVPVDLTTGQATGNRSLLEREYGIWRNAEGTPAAAEMRDFVDRQQTQLAANIPALQQRVGGVGIERGQGGEIAANRLVDMEADANRQANRLYDEARATGADVTLGAQDTTAAGQRMADRLLQDHAVENIPAVQREVDRLGQFAQQAGEGGVPIRRLFETRQRLNSVREQGGEEAVAARKAIGSLDTSINDALDSALFQGSEEGVEAWRRAIGNYREYAQTYRQENIIGRLVERDPRNVGADGRPRLKRDPAEAANFIFGQTDMGLINKRDLARDITQVRDLLGADSQEWRALKEEAFLRIARKSFGQTLPNAGAGNGRAFSGTNLFNAWDKFTSDNPQLAAVIFTPEQRRDIGNWVQVARETTVRDPASFAPSTSPLQMRNTMRRLFNRTALARIPGLNLLSEALLQSLENAAGVRGARGATQGPLPARPRPPPRGAPAGLVPVAGQFGGNLLSGP